MTLVIKNLLTSLFIALQLDTRHIDGILSGADFYSTLDLGRLEKALRQYLAENTQIDVGKAEEAIKKVLELIGFVSDPQRLASELNYLIAKTHETIGDPRD